MVVAVPEAVVAADMQVEMVEMEGLVVDQFHWSLLATFHAPVLSMLMALLVVLAAMAPTIHRTITIALLVPVVSVTSVLRKPMPAAVALVVVLEEVRVVASNYRPLAI